MTTKRLAAAIAGILFLCTSPVFPRNQSATPERDPSSTDAYETSREQTLVGTVLSYSNASPRAPFGPRLTLQTASGVIDIHLGDARTLAEKHFTVQVGDSLRVIGETVRLPNNNSQFLARILQKGDQAIAVRTSHGFPIPATTPAVSGDGKQQRGAM